MAIAYLGLGSNLGDRAKMLELALQSLARSGQRILAQSRVYETEPWGVVDQPRFLNSACVIETNLGPFALLDLCKEIECGLGRVQSERYGPRAIDLDILLYDELVLDAPRLVVPHPGLVTRATALLPLADIAADVIIPTTGRTIGEHLRDLGELDALAIYPPGLSD